MSTERTPILSGAVPCLEMLMTAWEQLGEKNPDLAPFTSVALDWAVKYYKKMDQTSAYVVTMCEWTPSLFCISSYS